MIRVSKVKSQQGISLIELVISMLIIVVALSGFFVTMLAIARGHSEPLIEAQAINIGQFYLDEILTKGYPKKGKCISRARNREQFTSICDYAGLNGGEFSKIADHLGDEVLELEHYMVKVRVSFIDIGMKAARIDVIVFHPQVGEVLFSGIKVKA